MIETLDDIGVNQLPGAAGRELVVYKKGEYENRQEIAFHLNLNPMPYRQGFIKPVRQK